MGRFKILLFFFCVVGVTEANLDYGDDLVYQSCRPNDKPSSTFKHNLDFALQNLSGLSSFTRYAIATIGSGENKIHAMFQCRGDLSPQGCMQCLAKAIISLQTPPYGCPFAAAADIQLNACYLRYENRTFTPDFRFVESICRSSMNDSVSLQAVVEKAIAVAPKNGGFAVARGSNGYVGIAQCLGYLSEAECAQCLSKAASHYNDSSFFGLGYCPRESVHLASCYYRYEKTDYLSASIAMRPPQYKHNVPARTPAPRAISVGGESGQYSTEATDTTFDTDVTLAANLRKFLQMKGAM